LYGFRLIVEVATGQETGIQPTDSITLLQGLLITLCSDSEQLNLGFFPLELFSGFYIDEQEPFAFVEFCDLLFGDCKAELSAEGGVFGQLLRVGCVELYWSVVERFGLLWFGLLWFGLGLWGGGGGRLRLRHRHRHGLSLILHCLLLRLVIFRWWSWVRCLLARDIAQ